MKHGRKGGRKRSGYSVSPDNSFFDSIQGMLYKNYARFFRSRYRRTLKRNKVTEGFITINLKVFLSRLIIICLSGPYMICER